MHIMRDREVQNSFQQKIQLEAVFLFFMLTENKYHVILSVLTQIVHRGQYIE